MIFYLLVDTSEFSIKHSLHHRLHVNPFISQTGIDQMRVRTGDNNSQAEEFRRLADEEIFVQPYDICSQLHLPALFPVRVINDTIR